MSVQGASQFRNAAVLANTRGFAAQSSTLLGAGDALSLLDAGRSALGIPGFGASPSARSLNRQLANRSADVNTMFSLTAATGAATGVDAARQQIMALRSSLPDSQLSRQALAEKYGVDDGTFSAASTGRTVDTEA